LRWAVRGLVGLALAAALAIAAALALVASSPPSAAAPEDVFGFARLPAAPPPDLPPLQTFAARDGEELAFRRYDSAAERVLVFVHGSSYHGASYHALASRLSRSGAAKVVLPNLRGHYLSGRRRGDVDYVGQLEDDVFDLVAHLRAGGWRGPVTLGGHSSGGGFAIRFAGGASAGTVSSQLLLAPVVPGSPALRGGTAGGWARVHLRRVIGLVLLNAVGIHGFDALPVIEFAKPRRFWDGSETLAYSFRLNASYHPRADHARDLRALRGRPLLVLVGADDEAVDGEALRELFADVSDAVEVLPGVDHFGVYRDPAVLERIERWLQAL
jgi:alpha-beta hydrolase superfamily lysophospholipase